MMLNGVENRQTNQTVDEGHPILGRVLIILGIAMVAISLAFMVTGVVSATQAPGTRNLGSPETQDAINAISGTQMAGVWAVFPLAIGIGLIYGGNAQFLPQKKKEIESATSEQVQIENKKKKWRTVALTVGFFIAVLGAGFIAAAIVNMKYVPSIRDLINNHPAGESESWWQSLNASWLDPLQSKLNWILTGGIFTTTAGGGLMLTGTGITTLKAKWQHWRHGKQDVVAQKAQNEQL